MKKNFYIFLVFVLGVVFGGYLFYDSQPRSFLNLNNCDSTCLKPKDLLGLIASVGIKLAPTLPGVIKETDKTLVIKHPVPEGKIHYVLLPKKDMKDIASIAREDVAYITDAMAVVGELVREYKMKKYKVVTYGQAYQHVTYLHFHLISND